MLPFAVSRKYWPLTYFSFCVGQIHMKCSVLAWVCCIMGYVVVLYHCGFPVIGWDISNHTITIVCAASGQGPEVLCLPCHLLCALKEKHTQTTTIEKLWKHLPSYKRSPICLLVWGSWSRVPMSPQLVRQNLPQDHPVRGAPIAFLPRCLGHNISWALREPCTARPPTHPVCSTGGVAGKCSGGVYAFNPFHRFKILGLAPW